jgi:glutamine amidotransferase
MKLVIIDYGSGNLRSVENAFKNSIVDNNIKCNIEVTNNLKLIAGSDFLVLPGVGSFPDCKEGLTKIKGLIEVLNDKVINRGCPFLGICVGMQLLADHSYEKVKTSGLGWLKGSIEKINNIGLDYLGRKLKIPHMGWNNLQIIKKKHPIFKNIIENEHFYFAHSYYLNTLQIDQVMAETFYGHKIPAIIGKENYVGVQFHPEKSGLVGQKFITNWLKWKP